ERQIEATSRRLDKTDHLRHKPLEFFIATKKLRFWETVLQRTEQRLGIVAELDGAHAFACGGDEDRTERALANRKANDVAAPAAAELRRRHAEQAGRGGVEPSVGVEARAIDRLRDTLAGEELLA